VFIVIIGLLGKITGNGGGLAKNRHLKSVSPKPKPNLRLNVDASFID